MGRTTSRGFGNGPRPARGSAPIAWWGPARAARALLLWVADERAVCVPTSVVLTCGCTVGIEVDGVGVPRGSCRVCMRMGLHGWSFGRDIVVRSQTCLILESWWRPSGCVRGTGMRPLQPLKLLILLQVPLCLGWGTGIWCGGRALERMHRSKNSTRRAAWRHQHT